MPFGGAVAPVGWLLCNGAEISSVTDPVLYEMFKDPVTSVAKTPDLRGEFLRGTGTNTVSGLAGPALNDTQEQSTPAHNHTVTVAPSGVHQHDFRNSAGTNTGAIVQHGMVSTYAVHQKASELSVLSTSAASPALGDPIVDIGGGVMASHTNRHNIPPNSFFTKESGSHAHTTTVGNHGSGTEVRPHSYGVNYIIKR
jgi:microcystin-dependent protein